MENIHTYQQSGSNKSEARVLHAAVREGRWQDQEVVLPPNVRASQVLCDFKHRFSLEN